MNKAAIASLFALAALPLTSAFAQGTGQVQMDAAETAVYDNAINKITDPSKQAAALEDYLSKYPKSQVKDYVLLKIMLDYSQSQTPGDHPKAVTAADNVLQVSPTNLQAYVIEVAYRKEAAEAQTDASAKQSGLDAAANYAQKGLDASKGSVPSGTKPEDWAALTAFATPQFYSVIGEDNLNKKNGADAVAAFKAELAAMKPDQLTTPAALQETYYLANAYYVSNPPDYVNCAFYATRAAALAPDQYKPQLQPLADYCFKKRHGNNKEGYDAVVAAAKASANPPADFEKLIPPAPTDADQANALMASTGDTDIPKLATGDKEYVLQYGNAANAAKVWDSIKGKSVEIPGALVIESSPTIVKVAVSDGAVQDKKADFTFTLKPLEEPKGAVAKKAYDKQVADIAAATAVGQKVTLEGTYDSYTPNPIMIMMTDASVITPKAAKTAPAAKPRPGAHHR